MAGINKVEEKLAESIIEVKDDDFSNLKEKLNQKGKKDVLRFHSVHINTVISKEKLKEFFSIINNKHCLFDIVFNYNSKDKDNLPILFYLLSEALKANNIFITKITLNTDYNLSKGDIAIIESGLKDNFSCYSIMINNKDITNSKEINNYFIRNIRLLLLMSLLDGYSNIENLKGAILYLGKKDPNYKANKDINFDDIMIEFLEYFLYLDINREKIVYKEIIGNIYKYIENKNKSLEYKEKIINKIEKLNNSSSVMYELSTAIFLIVSGLTIYTSTLGLETYLNVLIYSSTVIFFILSLYLVKKGYDYSKLVHNIDLTKLKDSIQNIELSASLKKAEDIQQGIENKGDEVNIQQSGDNSEHNVASSSKK